MFYPQFVESKVNVRAHAIAMLSTLKLSWELRHFGHISARDPGSEEDDSTILRPDILMAASCYGVDHRERDTVECGKFVYVMLECAT